MVDSVTDPDDRRLYCRRLGHQVPFRYCRFTAGDTPCPGIVGCWENDSQMRRLAEEIGAKTVPTPTPDKAVHLYALIQRSLKG